MLTKDRDYTISGSTVIIKKDYLSGFAADSVLSLTFVFSSGASQTVTIRMVDTTTAAEPEQVEPPMPAVELTDLVGHWAQDNIRKLVALGSIEGYPDGTFRPNNNITRAEFVKLLVTALKLQPQAGRIFEDTRSHWAQDMIATANAHGIINGYSAAKFGPDDLISREQMAIMAVKAVKQAISTEEIAFLDLDEISSWAIDAIRAAKEHGIIDGYPDNSFRPAGHATRAEAATVILRLIGLEN